MLSAVLDGLNCMAHAKMDRREGWNSDVDYWETDYS